MRGAPDRDDGRLLRGRQRRYGDGDGRDQWDQRQHLDVRTDWPDHRYQRHDDHGRNDHGRNDHGRNDHGRDRIADDDRDDRRARHRHDDRRPHRWSAARGAAGSGRGRRHLGSSHQHPARSPVRWRRLAADPRLAVAAPRRARARATRRDGALRRALRRLGHERGRRGDGVARVRVCRARGERAMRRGHRLHRRAGHRGVVHGGQPQARRIRLPRRDGRAAQLRRSHARAGARPRRRPGSPRAGYSVDGRARRPW